MTCGGIHRYKNKLSTGMLCPPSPVFSFLAENYPADPVMIFRTRRAHRMGQKEEVIIYKISVDETIEDRYFTQLFSHLDYLTNWCLVS